MSGVGRDLKTVALFCRVIDNFGDIGVCWRLARQLAQQHRLDVTLWVDALDSFQRICPAIDPHSPAQRQQGVCIRHWSADFSWDADAAAADLVIEGFGCRLPQPYLAAMARRTQAPVWINLEYLSAESWIEDFHGQPSYHPDLPLVKHFLFPGFSAASGGLLREPDLLQRRQRFQGDPAHARQFLQGIGAMTPPDALPVSVFCYPHAPLESLLAAWSQQPQPLILYVPQGVAPAAVGAFLGCPASAGAYATRGQLSVQVIPFLEQPDYDLLLWSCALNLVRGEDSLARAQWSGRPFLWHIYPQNEDAHLDKLDAFLGRYTEDMPEAAAHAVRQMHGAWNRGGEQGQPALQLLRELPRLTAHMAAWERKLLANDELSAHLLRFARNIG